MLIKVILDAIKKQEEKKGWKVLELPECLEKWSQISDDKNDKQEDNK